MIRTAVAVSTREDVNPLSILVAKLFFERFDKGCNIMNALMEGENGNEKQNDYIN